MNIFRLTLTTLTTLFVLLFHSALSAGGEAETPKPFTATYKASYSGIGITATRSLRPLNDNTQEFRFHAKSWLAEIDETSRLHWDEQGQIIPQQYHYQRTGLGKNRETLLDFDWKQQTVTNKEQSNPWSMNTPSGVLDKLSYQLQLRNDLLNQRDTMSYRVADGGSLSTYKFSVMGDEILETAIGQLNTVKVERVRKNSDRVTYLWLAKDWDYLVIKIVQLEDGQDYEINLTSAELDGVEVKGF